MLRDEIIGELARYWAWRAHRGPNTASSDNLVNTAVNMSLRDDPGFNAFALERLTDDQVYRIIGEYLMASYATDEDSLRILGFHGDLDRLAPFMEGSAEWLAFIQEYNRKCPEEFRTGSSSRRNSSSRRILTSGC